MTDPTLISAPNWSERLGMALLELIEHLPTGGFGAENTAGVLVTIGLDQLVSGIGAAGSGHRRPDLGPRCATAGL